MRVKVELRDAISRICDELYPEDPLALSRWYYRLMPLFRDRERLAYMRGLAHQPIANKKQLKAQIDNFIGNFERSEDKSAFMVRILVADLFKSLNIEVPNE